MKLRIARKILRDPHRHSAHQLLIAARRASPGWFDPTEDPADVAYMARSVMGDHSGTPAARSVSRWCWRRQQGVHDWAWRQVDLPF